VKQCVVIALISFVAAICGGAVFAKGKKIVV
jgi:hypothetical protein